MSSGKDRQFATDIETAERDAAIARYWVGRTIGEVAAHFRLSPATVSRARQRAIDAARRGAGEETIAAENLKLDGLEAVAYDVLRANHYAVSEGRVVKLDGAPLTDHKPVLMAIDRLLRIVERRAKLNGHDAPTQSVMTVINEDAIDAAIRE